MADFQAGVVTNHAYRVINLQTGATATATLTSNRWYDAQKAVVHLTQAQESDAYIL